MEKGERPQYAIYTCVKLSGGQTDRQTDDLQTGQATGQTSKIL